MWEEGVGPKMLKTSFMAVLRPKHQNKAKHENVTLLENCTTGKDTSVRENATKKDRDNMKHTG